VNCGLRGDQIRWREGILSPLVARASSQRTFSS